MAYNLVFKKNISPTNKVGKSFDSTTAQFSVVLKEDTNIFRPTFILQTEANLGGFNYIDGSAFSGRQYFITKVTSIGYNRYEVEAMTDVLDTWATQIKANDAVVSRQENVYNLYLDDPYFHVYNYERIQTLKFPNNAFMKSLQYVLVTNGYSQSLHDFSQLKNEEVKDNAD